MQNHKLNYIEIKVDEKVYMENILDIIVKFKEDLKEKIFIIKNEDAESLKLMKDKQVYLVRNGFLDIVIRILATVEENEYVRLSVGPKKVDQLKLAILDLFTILTYDNPFLIILYFTKDIASLIFKTVSKNEFNFYIHKLKVLKKYNYKVNLFKFVTIFNERIQHDRRVI